MRAALAKNKQKRKKMPTDAKLEDAIEKALQTNDLKHLTLKSVFLQMQTTFGVDMSSKKEFIQVRAFAASRHPGFAGFSGLD